jgi:uncharacterized protein (DUF2147 family)
MNKLIFIGRTAAGRPTGFGARHSRQVGAPLMMKSGKPKAVVQISQSGNTFNGRIVSLAEGREKTNARPASPAKPLIGLKRAHRPAGKKTANMRAARFTTRKSGKTYSAKAELANGGKSLKVRGFMGVFGVGPHAKPGSGWIDFFQVVSS